MKLKFKKNGVIYDAEKIITPTGVFTGKELYNYLTNFQEKSFETTLSARGLKRLNELIEDGEEYVKKFHILIPNWGWCLVIIEEE